MPRVALYPVQFPGPQLLRGYGGEVEERLQVVEGPGTLPTGGAPAHRGVEVVHTAGTEWG